MADGWMFVGALAVAYLVPGPDMVLILHTGALQGRAQALAVAIGLALARATHVFLAAIGLAALLRTAPWAFEVVRVAGAAYLIWLGLGVLRSRSLKLEGPRPSSNESGRSMSQAAVRGFLTNLLNPKALGAILVATGLAFDLVYAGTGATLSRWAVLHPLNQALQRWVFAALLVGFGLRLALSQRPL